LTFSSLLFVAACGQGPYAETIGTVNGTTFDDVRTVFHGGSFIVLFLDELECTDVSWVRKTYSPGQLPENAPSDFTGIQLAFDAEPQPGTFSMAGDGAAAGMAYWAVGGAFDYARARDGIIEISEIDRNGEWVEGQVNASFGSDTVSGKFRTEFCLNLVR
jgi:hypothetical protein